MATCLQPSQAAKLRQAVEDGRVDVDSLASMSSENRVAELKKTITDTEMLQKFNKEFESRIITSARDLANRKLPFTEESVKALGRQQKFSDLKNMGKTERRKTIKQYLDAESAKYLSDVIDEGTEKAYKQALAGVFDRKLSILNERLAKRQRKILMDFVNREASGIPKKRKPDILDRISKNRHLLTPTEQQLFLRDLLAQKLGIGISEETALKIATLADEAEVGMKMLKDTQEKVFTEARKMFNDSPEVRRRAFKKADEMSPEELKAAEIDFANQVWMGILKPDGTKATKAEYRQVFMQQREWVLKTGELTSYVSKLEEGIDKITIQQIREARGVEKWKLTQRMTGQLIYELLAGSKSAAASLDFSYVFRQGWQTALTNPFLLAKNAGLAIKDMTKFMLQAKRKAGADDGFIKSLFNEYDTLAYDNIRLEIMRRPNALNGKYDAASNGYGLGVFREEAFPVTWPERAPGLLGRVYKMTEIGFNSTALRMRADLADNFIAKMEAKGVNVYDKEIADELGLLVGAMTGRGKPFGTDVLEGKESLNKVLNATFFSPRFIGSQFHTIWAPFKWIKDPTDPVLALSRDKALQAFGTLAGLIVLVNYSKELFGTDARVDVKPSSSTFGHIVIGNNAFDITGAHGSVIALIGKMVDQRNAEKRWDNKLQIYTDSMYGQSVMGLLGNFFLYKASPGASTVKDLIEGHRFGDEELNAKDMIMGIVVPITLANFYEQTSEAYLGNISYADGVLVTVGEVVGISSKDMRISPLGKEWKAIRDYDSGMYNKAVAEFNEVLWEEVQELRESPSFQKLSEEEQYKEIDKMADRIKKRAVTPYVRQLPADMRP